MLERNKNLSDSVENIPHVGPALAGAFERLHVKTVEDLFRFIPRDIIDLSNPISAKEAQKKDGEKVVLFGEIEDLKVIKTPKRRIWLTSAKIKDDTGKVRVVWFNQPYLRTFFKDQKYAFFGPVEYSNFTKDKTMLSPQIFASPGVITIYRQSEGLSSKQIQRSIKFALEAGYNLDNLVLDNLASKYKMPKSQDALLSLHFPKNVGEFYRAKERFIFDELLFFISANLYLKNLNAKKSSYKIDTDQKLLNQFISELPFELTDDQNKAMSEIVKDLGGMLPMNRILQGDVGSGKTVVALAAAYLAIKSGQRVAFLAPTQILASQHYQTANKLLTKLGVSVGLMTADTNRKFKTQNSKLKSSAEKLITKDDLIIGTHAIIQESVEIPNLALVIVDEQHRFGVEQRNLLINQKSQNAPHFLSLSATPIPRTLAHIIFGNLDISTIFSKPKGRLPIKTYLVPQTKRNDSYKFIDDLIKKGQQAFVVCPLIEEQQTFTGTLFDLDGRKAVETEIKNLKATVLKKRNIEMLHGRMKAQDKEDQMAKMQDGSADVLVATSVVEVGVDLPRATVMVIEGAEHFGLSQLHQFRGRVGRNDLPSYCFLFTSGDLNDKTKQRLKAFVQNDDGFKLSQMDLKGRGPGAVLGNKQSGFFGINPVWFENSEILAKASKAAKALAPNLDKSPDLLKKITAMLETEHLE